MKKIVIAIILMASNVCIAQERKTKTSNAMNIEQIYTVFITKKLKETVSFYETYFGFSKVFESTFFVLLQTSGNQKYTIAFMDETHPTAPPTPKAFHGSGSFLTVEVLDARASLEQLKNKGFTIAYELKDEPWGQRRFAVVDPNGLWVDVVQQTEPVEGFWEKYMKD